MRGNWQNILFLLLVFGLPALSWIAGRIKEQADVRKRRSQADRRASESLRSTPTVSRSAANAADGDQPALEASSRGMEEARRRAELEALRQRRLAELQARSSLQRRSGPQAAQPTRTAGASGLAVPATQRQPAQRTLRQSEYAAELERRRREQQAQRQVRQPSELERQRRAREQQERRRKEQDQREAQQGQQRRRPALRERAFGSTLAEPDLAEAPPIEVEAPAAAERVPAVARSIRNATLADWREAIVMSEILSPPVSLRDQPAAG